MKKILFIICIGAMGAALLTSCYNNKYDMLDTGLAVSFSKEVVPIMTSGACGCHNTEEQARTVVQFSDGLGEIYDNTIASRASLMAEWAEGKIAHPGGGSVILTDRDKLVIMKWIAQGEKIDYNDAGGTITGPVTYTANVAGIVTSGTCAGSTCHGGQGPALTYSVLSNPTNLSHLQEMANTGGASGHPYKGVPKIPLSPSTTAILKAWIDQGAKQ